MSGNKVNKYMLFYVFIIYLNHVLCTGIYQTMTLSD